MADNSTLPATGDVIRDVDRGSAKTQVFALDINPSGSETLMNGSLPIRAATLPLTSTTWNAATALNTVLPVTCSGYSTVIVNQNNSGSLTSGTLAFEVSDDGGTTWWDLFAVADGGSIVSSTPLLTAFTGQVFWRVNVVGFYYFRVRLQAQVAGGGGVILHLDCNSIPTDTLVGVTNTPANPIYTTSSVQSSPATPLYTTSSITNSPVTPIYTSSSVANSPATPLTVTNTAATPLFATSSITNSPVTPLYTSSSVVNDPTKPLYVSASIVNDPTKPVYTSSSIANSLATALYINTSSVVAIGNVGHGVADSGNPLLHGGVAISHGANPTAVTSGQRTKFYANVAGVPFVMGGHPNIQSLVFLITTASVNAQIITGSTLRYVVTQAQVLGGNANTNFPTVQIGFGSTVAPTVLGLTGSQNVLYHPGIPAGGGTSRGDGSGIITIAPSASMPLLGTFGGPSGTLSLVVSFYTIDA